jgi:glycosyltransferase involved in cell wall biosynthesis
MRVGLNATSFYASKLGGAGVYFLNLLAELQDLPGEGEYLLLCDRKAPGAFALRNPRFGMRTYDYMKPSVTWLVRGAVRRITGFDIAGPALDRLNLDVMHHPFGVLSPDNGRTPAILTFLDMQHEFLPEFFDAAELARRRTTYRKSARAAKRVIAISEHVRQCLIDRYAVHPARIDTVHLGHDKRFAPIADRRQLERTRDAHGLHRPFLYYPSATWRHKNHLRLLDAFRELRSTGFDGELVLSGPAMQQHDAVMQRISELRLADCVRHLGVLDYMELPRIYNLARAVVFPSLFEGFGIPLVEALACGRPLACSDSSAIPEVVADAGVYFDPNSTEAIAQGIMRVWDDERLRGTLVERGLQRAREFTWAACARKTVEAYRRTAAG